ncbi:hypothetical protein ACPV47_16195 [Vibrio jasicida]|uniref:hypothetical protein n=1 Tax=Vibrio jasicida TaxID=766224 RepID=UPI004067A729
MTENKQYFHMLADIVSKVIGQQQGHKLGSKFSFDDILTLAKREAALNKDGRDYQTTDSGKEFQQYKDEFIKLIGKIPREEIIKQSLKESYFDKIDTPKGLPLWQQRALEKVAKADASGDLQVRSLSDEFRKKVEQGYIFNNTPIDVDSNSPLTIIKHLLGDALSFDNFYKQYKYCNSVSDIKKHAYEKNRNRSVSYYMNAYSNNTKKEALSELENIDESDVLGYEYRLMKNKARKIFSDDNISKIAKNIASHITGDYSNKYAQALLFNCIYELSKMKLDSGNNTNIYEAADNISSVLLNSSKSTKNLIKEMKDKRSIKFHQKALHQLRKARASGRPEKVIDAIAACISIFMGGNASDLNQKLQLECSTEFKK